ncbi:MAG TPA: 50S ribosomal protein L20 [Patescibacteria group bacterium]|jgi:large subunit ribosomal protein L20|nr:50S ribosomal protein L20 [Patescibacteria group bacterium]
MTRIKRGVAASKRRKNLLKRAKGFDNRRSTNFRQAREALLKADTYAYRDRRNRKRDQRALWLVRLGAALRDSGTTWSKFAAILKKENVEVNRKMLSEMAIKTPASFDKMVVELVK